MSKRPGGKTSNRQQVLWLALVLDCLGMTPEVSGYSYYGFKSSLATQLRSVDQERRAEAEKKAKRRSNQTGGIEKLVGHLVPSPPESWPYHEGWPTHEELIAYERKMADWDDSTPPCPVCRLLGDLPKRSWPDPAMAEEVRLRSDPTVKVYECPVQPGYWHLGHPRKAKGNLARAGAVNAANYWPFGLD